MIAIIGTISNVMFCILALWLAKWFEKDRQKIRSYASFGLAAMLAGLAVLSLIDVLNHVSAM